MSGSKPKKRHRNMKLKEEKEETIMNKTVHGKVHGKTIELDEDLGQSWETGSLFSSELAGVRAWLGTAGE